MKKKGIIVTILMLAVGFAAISTTLIINGSAKVGENIDDFSVIFTKATLDETDVYANVISQDKKTITFETTDLKALNQTSVLNYEVTNNSANYDAEVQVNCKVKNNGTAKYTSIENVLEGNATVIKAKNTVNGTLTITLERVATEKVREEYTCVVTATAKERDELGVGIPNPVSFSRDTWETIQKAVQTDNTNLYNIGDTKSINLGEFGTHTLRVANKSECTNGETSETACGFVVEFADIITSQKMNSTDTNVGGWPASEARAYINSTILSALPSDLQNVITTTKVISGHGSTTGETNFTSTDKLYLLSTKEVWGETKYDTVNTETKQLDYYKNLGVTLENTTGAVKQYSEYHYNEGKYFWWLRTACSSNNVYFMDIIDNGTWNDPYLYYSRGISPAFRIA